MSEGIDDGLSDSMLDRLSPRSRAMLRLQRAGRIRKTKLDDQGLRDIRINDPDAADRLRKEGNELLQRAAMEANLGTALGSKELVDQASTDAIQGYALSKTRYQADRPKKGAQP